MNVNDVVKLANNTAMVEWADIADRWLNAKPGAGPLPAAGERPGMDEAVRYLDATIERLARFRAYLDERHGYGCGDQGHAAAVKASNQLAAKVRKALGYTVPKQDVSF